VGYRTPMDPAQTKPSGVPAQRDAGSGVPPDVANDAGRDIGNDAARVVPVDLRPDLLPDGRPDLAPDGRPDLPPDVRPDLPPDVRPDLPPDVRPDLPPDGRPDLPPDGRLLASCPSGDHFVLLLGGDGRLYRFDSFSLALTTLATVSCGSYSLNSLTVSPIGPAYISSAGAELCRVDLTTFKSTLTPFDPMQIELVGARRAYGMALLPDSSTAGQTLYIAVEGGTNVNHLKRIDLTTYALTNVGDISPAVPWAELTAGPNGELYGFAVGTTESLLLNIDPKTASAIDVTHVPAGFVSAAFALVYWQDGFYLFLSDSQTQASSVYHYRKGDAQVTPVGTVNASIIGAGVAACP